MSRDGVGRGSVPRSRPLPCQGPAQSDEHEQRLERLWAELEAERRRCHELIRCFIAETCELKDAVKWDQQLLAQRLHATWEQWQELELQRLQQLNRRQRSVEICHLLRSKEAELQEELEQQSDDAVHQARHLQQQLAKELGRRAGGSSEAHGKLQGVLRKLCSETNGEQASHILHPQEELLLRRRLFQKYLSEQFEEISSCNETRTKATAWHCLPTLLGTGAIRPCSLESLMTSSSCDGDAQHKTQQSLRDACLQEEGNSMEVLLKAVGQDLVPHSFGSLPHGRADSERSVAEVGVQTVGQQDDCLPGGRHSRLLEQNAYLQSALKELERQCSVLQEENSLLRKASSPEVQKEEERLKQKTTKVCLLSKQLQDTARQLQNIVSMINTRDWEALERLKQKMAKLGLISKQLQGIARQLVNTQVPLPIQSSAEELCRPSFPQQRAAEMGELTRALLAQDEQDDFSHRAAEDLQAQVAADEEGYQLVRSYRCSLWRRQTKTPNWLKKSLASVGRWVWQIGHLR